MPETNPAASPLLPPPRRLVPAALVLLGLWLLGSVLSGLPGGRELALSLWLGTIFGVLLQRSRFCFYCVSRDFIETRDARGLLGILAALAVGTLAYHAVFGAFLTEPVSTRLPPGAHIGPVSWVLVAGAFSFGLGMAIAGSCISAQLYRLGEGALAAPAALLGTAIGFILGFLSWNHLYLGALQEAPTPWLPHSLGYGGSLIVQLLALCTIALLLARIHRTSAPADATQAWWQRRWPTWAGGALIGTLGAVAYLRIAPLGVTAELGSLSRTVADGIGLLPARLEGLDTLRGCVSVVKETLWSNNGALITGLVLGSFAAALFSGDFRPRLPGGGELLRSFGGGILMGWGAMVALGCTVGALLSGIMAAALSGWIFALCCAPGLYLGWWLRRRLG
jgi:uncharacterized membrane protein YedE/YeeE